MSIFKTKGIITHIKKIKENDFLYTIFTSDYGTIKTNKKVSKTNSKALDIGYIIHFEIITSQNQNIHKMSNITIFSEFSCDNKTFDEIHHYLLLLKTIYKNIPAGVPQKEIFDIMEKINVLQNNSGISSTKMILAHLKIIHLLGNLSVQNSDITLKKILSFISQNKIDTILKLSGIDNTIKENLERILVTY